MAKSFSDVAAAHATIFGLSRSGLVWRFIVPLPLALIGAIVLTWVLIPRIIRQNVVDEAIIEGQQISGQFQTLRGYYTDHVVAKILAHGSMRATSDHMTNPNAIPLPATMILDLSNLLAKRDITIKLYSNYPFPDRADRRLDAFQQEALKFLTANPKAAFSRAEIQDNKHVVRTAAADIMTAQACVSCHNTTKNSPKRADWKVGDVRGVLEVDSDIDRQLADGLRLSNYIIVGIVATGLVLLIVLFLAARSVIGPLREIARQTTNLATGKLRRNLAGRRSQRRDRRYGESSAEIFRKHGLEVERLRAERAEREKRMATDRKADLQKLADQFQDNVGAIVDAVSSTASQLEDAAKRLAETAKITERHSGSGCGNV